MAPAKLIRTFTFNGVVCAEYLCEKAGDELPLHSHTFNHLTKVTNGEVEVFDDSGKTMRGAARDAPFEYVAGRKHGIRAVTDGAMFFNISPILGGDVP